MHKPSCLLVKGNKLSSDSDHWILVTENDDGTVNVHDPLALGGARPWAAETVPALQMPTAAVTVKAAGKTQHPQKVNAGLDYKGVRRKTFLNGL